MTVSAELSTIGGDGTQKGAVAIAEEIERRALEKEVLLDITRALAAPFDLATPASPTSRNSIRYICVTCPCVSPRQRSMAQASIWRVMKRRAAIATATAASMADSKPTSDRKRSARSSVLRPRRPCLHRDRSSS